MRYLLLILAVLALVGCNGGSSNTAEDTPPDTCTIQQSRHDVRHYEMGNGITATAIIEYMDEVVSLNGVCPPPTPDPPVYFPPTPDKCHDFITNIRTGLPVRWTVQEPFVIDPSNLSGMDENQVASEHIRSVMTWEAEVATAYMGAAIIAPISASDRAMQGQLNGKNEVMFDEVDFLDAVAVAWTFHNNGKILESDIIFDDIDYEWTLDGDLEPDKMDFGNISTHEVGHTSGLRHADADLCEDHTMQPFVGFGETRKKTLEFGDISGIRALYGTPPIGVINVSSNVWDTR